MAEQSLPEPLSGEEIVIDLADRIAEALRRDAKLRPHMAYESYGARVTISLWAVDLGAKAEVRQEIVIGPAKPEDAPEQPIAEEIPPAPPNEVRVRSGQPVPTLTKGPDGRPAVKKVQYARKSTSTKPGDSSRSGVNASPRKRGAADPGS